MWRALDAGVFFFSTVIIPLFLSVSFSFLTAGNTCCLLFHKWSLRGAETQLLFQKVCMCTRGLIEAKLKVRIDAAR